MMQSQGLQYIMQSQGLQYTMQSQGLQFIKQSQGLHYIMRSQGLHYIIRSQGIKQRLHQRDPALATKEDPHDTDTCGVVFLAGKLFGKTSNHSAWNWLC